MPDNRYTLIIERIFQNRYVAGESEMVFDRQEIADVAQELGMERPKNLGDVVYSFRFRAKLPQSIRSTEPAGRQWVIRKCGQSKYRFVLVAEWSVAPSANQVTIKIPDATPGILERYALSDEQALLAKIRYNRLIDIFTGLATYSLQSHLRRGVKGFGQVETDEIYIGLDRHGAHYVMPVQAKAGRDRMSVVQIEQDFALCLQDFHGVVCRPIGAQFMAEEIIALFEFVSTDEGIKVSAERHYQLVAPDMLTAEELASYYLPGNQLPSQ
jgi:hypothetical protein